MSKEVTYWTSIIKKVLIVIFSIIGIWLSIKLIYFYLPFIIAFFIYLLIEPLIKKLMNRFKLTRKTSSIIVFVITFGIIIGVLIWGIVTVISESSNLLSNFNYYYERANDLIQNLLSKFNDGKINLPENIVNIIRENAFNLLEKFSEQLQEFLTKIISGITKIPTVAIYTGVSILALYFFCTDKIYMLDELEHHLPEAWMKKITKHIREIMKILGGYLKAQFILIFISFVICLIGLYIYHFMGLDVGFPLIIAIAIGFVDALPILGSGTVMIPWGVIAGLNGDLKLGILIIVLWIFMSIIRQFLEPKIVSGNIGIHPIFTIIAMYTGFKFLGVIGMFIGPIILIILKNIFANFLDNGIVKSILDFYKK